MVYTLALTQRTIQYMRGQTEVLLKNYLVIVLAKTKNLKLATQLLKMNCEDELCLEARGRSIFQEGIERWSRRYQVCPQLLDRFQKIKQMLQVYSLILQSHKILSDFSNIFSIPSLFLFYFGNYRGMQLFEPFMFYINYLYYVINKYNFNIKTLTLLMQVQKRIKTQGYDIRDISDKKQRKEKYQKSSNIARPHKQSQAHLKSISKDITPKKHSITLHRQKFKQGNSNKKIYKSKQLTSMCSYSAMDKQSIPVTKRKGSNARSVNGAKKKAGKNKQINQSLKSTVSNFGVLTKCLTQFIKQQKKKGKDPSVQILHLIKAFNKSQVAPLSKELQVLINNMLDYIEGTVGFSQEDDRNAQKNNKFMKSRSSFSSASDQQIVYSQILENSNIPTTVKKQKQNNMSKNQIKPHSKSLFNNSKNRKTNQSNFSESSQQMLQNGLKNPKKSEDQPHFERSISKKNNELEQQLKNDVQSMHEQLYKLKNAGQKLQVRIDSRGEDRKKLEQIYKKNKQLIEQIGDKNKEMLKVRETYGVQYEESEDED